MARRIARPIQASASGATDPQASLGHLGDVKPVAQGVYEMREFFGPGWRMYYARRGDILILMLGGGTKATQARDIAKAIALAETIADYIRLAIEDGDPGLLAAALGDVARARGMTQVAQATGLTREALYKALRPEAHPRFDTIQRVCRALGVKLTATAA